jgi:UDP-3-O-[3-hydroxymyristoyl] glucosamine N-acyltransferase
VIAPLNGAFKSLMKLSEIAKLLGGELSGNADTEIKSLGKIESANADEITFIANPVYEKFYNSTNAGAIIVSKRFKPAVSKRTGKKNPVIKVDDPYLAFLELLDVFLQGQSLKKSYQICCNLIC